MINNLSSSEKMLKILMTFIPHNHSQGTLELSKKLDIHKSTVSRLLHILTDYGFLQRNPETKKYMLGSMAAEIGNAVMRSLNTEIVLIAQSHLNQLCDDTGESVALEVVSGPHVVLAYHSEGRRHIRFTFQLGEQVPIHVAAGAKVILAHSAPEYVDVQLKGRLKQYTDNTIVSKKKYRKILEQVRQTGLAFDYGERYEDTRAIAAPILNKEGIALAAVVIAGPAFRLTDEFMKNVAPMLKKTAETISQRLFA